MSKTSRFGGAITFCRALTRFQAYLTDLPESRQVYFLAGDRDFLVHAAVRDTEALRADPDRSRAILDRIPAGRWGRPEDIGQSAVYLAAPASDYVNGAVLNVDGGWLAR